MSDSSILAIDFGTTNSYFCKCPADQISPVGVDFGSGRDGIPSAILYRRDKEPLVGNPALHEYGESSNEERKHYRLCTQFKPDITASEESAKNAEDFLRTVVEQSQRQHIVLDPVRHEVIVGVPSEAEKGFRTKLIEICRSCWIRPGQTTGRTQGGIAFSSVAQGLFAGRSPKRGFDRRLRRRHM